MAPVKVLRCQQANPRMVVLGVVPADEPLGKDPGVLHRPDALRKLRPVLQRLEPGFGEGVVIAGIRPAVGLVIARSASNKATGLERMDEPRSAWRVNWPGGILYFLAVSRMNRSARAALSRSAAIQPTT